MKMKKPVATTYSLVSALLLIIIIGLTVVYYTVSPSIAKLRLQKETAVRYYYYSSSHHVEVDPASRQAWNDIAGYWQGALGDEEDGLRLIHRITKNYGEAFTYSLDQGGGLIPATAAKLDDAKNTLILYFDTIGGIYIAQLDESRQKMTGKWRQGGGTFSLDMERFQETDSMVVPREFHFLLEKIVTIEDPSMMEQLVGFWSGYLDNNFDDDGDEPPELVTLQVEKMSPGSVEPKIWLPEETPLPFGIRTLLVGKDGTVKIVLDDLMGSNNAIFLGQLDGTTLTGVVNYDDTDYAPLLILTWSEHPPPPPPPPEYKHHASSTNNVQDDFIRIGK